MTEFVKKYGKLISVIIAVSILVSGIPFFANALKLNQVRAVDNENENRIAAEISNMTGATVEDVLKLRNSGRTWNEVLDRVKSSIYKKDNSDRREDVLTNTSLGDDYAEKLQKEGYDRDKIMDTKLRAERVIYDLKEITNQSDTPIKVEKPDEDLKIDRNSDKEADKDKEAVEACTRINEKFDIKAAVYLCIKLEKGFGSIDKALDEYLLSLQLELNLEEYLIDQKDYEKQKAEKTALYTKTIVNLEKIEDLVLKKLQTKDKDKSKEDSTSQIKSFGGTATTDDKAKSPLPYSTVPEVKDVKPQNPANEIMKEIQTIDPMKNGGK